MATTRCQYHWLLGLQVNKFEQVSREGGGPYVWYLWRRGGVLMLHLPPPPWTDNAYENIKFQQLPLWVVITSDNHKFDDPIIYTDSLNLLTKTTTIHWGVLVVVCRVGPASLENVFQTCGMGKLLLACSPWEGVSRNDTTDIKLHNPVICFISINLQLNWFDLCFKFKLFPLRVVWWVRGGSWLSLLKCSLSRSTSFFV